MSEFFLELFSEEIPSNLQKNLREDLLKKFNLLFSEKFISFKKSSSYSTPNRLIILFEGIQKQVVLKSEEIKGPSIKAPEIALEGFIRSNKITKKNLYENETDKGRFYFYKTKPKKIYTHDLLEEFIPIILQKIQWKKSMCWGAFDLHWGRPLKSILALFNKKTRNKDDFDNIISLIRKYKIIKECYQKAQHYINLASNSLTVFKDSKKKS